MGTSCGWECPPSLGKDWGEDHSLYCLLLQVEGDPLHPVGVIVVGVSKVGQGGGRDGQNDRGLVAKVFE